MLAFLRRNLYSCPIKIKETCFNSLVRPILDYCCVVWDPHYETDKEALEKIHKRAARFVTKNYTHKHGNTKTNMQKLGWEPLEERRAKFKVTLLFKAQNKLIDIPTEFLTLNNRKNRNGGHSYAIPASNVDSHLHSFYPSTIRLWNLLPSDSQKCDNVTAFKHKLGKITLRSTYN